MMLAGGSPTPPGPTPDPGDLSNYVQDGLVMHLDGKQKGETSGRWESVVGTAYYTFGAASTVEPNSVLMSGSGVILGTNVPAVGYTAGTIECVYEYVSGSSGIIIYAASSGLALIKGGAFFCFGVASSSNQWSCGTAPSSGTVSVNTNRCMHNGSVIGTSKANNSWGSGASTCPIGGRTSGSNKYYSNIRIYAIRKYNRLLTEAEMLQNQQTDNARFNLGLNI